MSTSTIHISITFDHEPIELNVLQDKLNWSNLVTLIDSMHPIETPVILYYKKDSTVETLENQEQLDELLIPNLKGLRFYGQKDLVNEPVYVFPGNALVRLTQFMDENKSVIASSHRLARWVGILASFISQDMTDASFDYEFQVLQNLVERKLNKSKRRERQHGETTDEQQEDCNEELSSRHRGRFGRENDPREKMFGHGSFGGRGHHGHGRKEDAETLFGHGPFGGRGRHFGGYGRHGRGNPREELFGYGSFGGHGLQGQDPRETFFGASPFGEHGFHFGGRGGRFGGGRGGHFGGRGGHFNGVFGDNGRSFQGPNSPFRGFGGPFGRHGGPFDGKHCHKAFFNADSSSEESGEESNKHNRDFTGFGKHGFGGKRFGKGMKGFYGRHGGFGRHASGFGPFGRGKKFGRCKKFGPEEDLFHGLHHGKGFKKHENHFHFA